MIGKKDFYCQYLSYSNERVAKSTCGITSVAMVLSAKNVFSPYINNNRNLDEFFIYVNSLHKNDAPCVKRDYFLGKKSVSITLGLVSRIDASEKDVISNDGIFFPAFVLYRGYDHRASEYIFSNFNLNALLREKLTAYDLYNLLNTQKAEYFLASIKNKFKDKDGIVSPTHIVVVQKAFENSSGVKMLEYIDPVEENLLLGIKTVTITEFEEEFNGFGTEVK